MTDHPIINLPVHFPFCTLCNDDAFPNESAVYKTPEESITAGIEHVAEVHGISVAATLPRESRDATVSDASPFAPDGGDLSHQSTAHATAGEPGTVLLPELAVPDLEMDCWA